ncbi:MAG: hypothetical protein EA383_06435 [Spirochaetaceae bacterium]|nr:MAG: hypothetical protein EA383_06435 [Spirochaetaceae bacterium]
MRTSRHIQLAQLTIPKALKVQLGLAASIELLAATVLVVLPESGVGLRFFAVLLGALGLHSLVSLQQAPYSMRSTLLLRVMAAGGICIAGAVDLVVNWPAAPGLLALGLTAVAAVSIPVWSYWLVRVGRLPQ